MTQKGIPIRRGDGKVIGYVEGDTFHKTIKQEHYLRQPNAIAFDTSSLEQAEQAGAIKIVVSDSDTGIKYNATYKRLRWRGVKFNRGHGHQIFLVMEQWTTILPGSGSQLYLWNST